jgi:drug/metabolite transporter (DMT)-like permease
MPTKLLILIVTLNTVVSQLFLKRAINGIGPPSQFDGVGRFILAAALSPWVYASLVLQVLGYVLWMFVLAREKLGVATASLGAGFYILMALSGWLVYGETLAPVQWLGILLITAGVVCVSMATI